MYRQHLGRAAKRLAASGVVECRQLCASSVTRFLESLDGSSSSTIAGYRRMILSLWRHAVRREWASGPVEARPVRIRLPPVRAWTPEQLSNLVKSASLQTGAFRRSRCPRATYWRAFVLLGYETGLRLGDLHSLALSAFDDDFRVLTTSAHKTGEPVVRALTDECSQALRDLSSLSPGTHLFLWALSRRHTKAGFTKLCKSCGLPGSVRWLRRSGATACEACSPGSASRYLGHRSPGVAARHYVDWSQVRQQPTPPAIASG